METFAELGVVGLGAARRRAAGRSSIGAIRARRTRYTAAAFGAFVAWSAAAAVDWHWEMVGVTLTALLAGAIGLVTAERGAPARLRGGRARPVLIAACVLLSVFAVWSLVGNQALFAGREALTRKDWVEARDDARRARALLFWSAEPELVLGDAAAGLGDRQGALQRVPRRRRDRPAQLGRLAPRRAGGARRRARGRLPARAPTQPSRGGPPGRVSFRDRASSCAARAA